MRMTDDEILRFQKRARHVASKYGYPQHADDFAQEVILTFIENPDRHSTVDQLFIDYLRKTHGNTRSVCGAARAKAELTACPLDDERDIADDTGDERRDWGCAFIFTGRKADIYQAYFIDEETEKTIAERFGVTESRICQILKPMKKEIQEYYLYREFRERLEWDPDFTKLYVDWIRL